MSGNVKQFVDFSVNTVADTGENNASSIQPILNGEVVDATVSGRPGESLRQRTETIRGVAADSLYLRDADRRLVVAGPGKVTWPGSTTASANGIPVITDTLWLLPLLTPGSAQTPPVPPTASAFGVLHLKRSSDSTNAISVISNRRSYAAGDQINVTVASGGAFSCVLDVETGYRRTIHIVATGATTLSAVITALNGLTPPAPDNTQLVTAALEGGASGSDLLLTPQTRQYVVGNYDGEGHTLTPSNLSGFFTSNPTQALAEGDTLCIEFSMVSDTASTGGRRQALPENSNTTVPAGSFFNSRVHPEKLVNAIPVCKVINGRLVFATGVEVLAGSVARDLGGSGATTVTYGGGAAWFDGTINPATTVEAQLDKVITDLGVAAGAAKIGFAGSGSWADGTTNPSVSIEAQFDKIVSDLAGAAGSAKIQGVANGTDLAVGTVKAQLDNISTNWFKLARDNTASGNQTFQKKVDVGGNLTVGGQALAFTNFTFTADPSTNQLTAIAHGLQTGDGMVQTTNSGGGLPGGLAPATDYWSVFIDADHIKVANSFINAILGITIDISTAGTGTHTLNHQAGTTRASDTFVTRTLTVGSLVVLGSVIGHLRTSDPLMHSMALVSPRGGATVDDTNVTLALNLLTSTAKQFLPLILPVGFIISAWEVRIAKLSLSGTLSATLVEIDSNAGSSTPGTTQSNSTSFPGFVSLGESGLSLTVLSGHVFHIEVTGTGNTGDFVLSYKITPG